MWLALTEDCEDPSSIPIYWISKWVDYSDKYGLGYQLCDNSVGVLFNDSTRLILTNNGELVSLLLTLRTPRFLDHLTVAFLHTVKPLDQGTDFNRSI